MTKCCWYLKYALNFLLKRAYLRDDMKSNMGLLQWLPGVSILKKHPKKLLTAVLLVCTQQTVADTRDQVITLLNNNGCAISVAQAQKAAPTVAIDCDNPGTTSSVLEQINNNPALKTALLEIAQVEYPAEDFSSQIEAANAAQNKKRAQEIIEKNPISVDDVSIKAVDKRSQEMIDNLPEWDWDSFTHLEPNQFLYEIYFDLLKEQYPEDSADVLKIVVNQYIENLQNPEEYLKNILEEYLEHELGICIEETETVGSTIKVTSKPTETTVELDSTISAEEAHSKLRIFGLHPNHLALLLLALGVVVVGGYFLSKVRKPGPLNHGNGDNEPVMQGRRLPAGVTAQPDGTANPYKIKPYVTNDLQQKKGNELPGDTPDRKFFLACKKSKNIDLLNAKVPDTLTDDNIRKIVELLTAIDPVLEESKEMDDAKFTLNFIDSKVSQKIEIDYEENSITIPIGSLMGLGSDSSYIITEKKHIDDYRAKLNPDKDLTTESSLPEFLSEFSGQVSCEEGVSFKKAEQFSIKNKISAILEVGGITSLVITSNDNSRGFNSGCIKIPVSYFLVDQSIIINAVQELVNGN